MKLVGIASIFLITIIFSFVTFVAYSPLYQYVLSGRRVGESPTKTKIPALAFSLFGNNSAYSLGLVKTVYESIAIYGGWAIFIYHDDNVCPTTIKYLRMIKGVKLINVEREKPYWIAVNVNPMSWRFLIASEETVSIFAVRDGDSMPSMREKEAVNEWIASGKMFHTMHDHPYHTPQSAPIMGGLWGGVAGEIRDMEKILKVHYYDANRTIRTSFPHGEDQDFLRKYIHPLVVKSCVMHDSYHCSYSGGYGFPIARENTSNRYDYVGNIFNRVSSLNESYFYEDKILYQRKNHRKYLNCLRRRIGHTLH